MCAGQIIGLPTYLKYIEDIIIPQIRSLLNYDCHKHSRLFIVIYFIDLVNNKSLKLFCVAFSKAVFPCTLQTQKYYFNCTDKTNAQKKR